MQYVLSHPDAYWQSIQYDSESCEMTATSRAGKTVVIRQVSRREYTDLQGCDGNADLSVALLLETHSHSDKE